MACIYYCSPDKLHRVPPCKERRHFATGRRFLFGMIRYMNEQCDIVNEQDQVITQKLRNEVKGDFVNTRYVNVFIRDSKGRFWIPMRKDDLKRWPSGPDFSVGGAVMAGEDYLAATLRETKEEVGLDVKPTQLKEIAYLSPYKYPVSCFAKVYELFLEDMPVDISNEYQSAQLYTLDELIVLLSANSKPTKTDLLPIVRLCYGALNSGDRATFSPV
jgi:8-oxo-dGTP pyrophosphatase MutT (NUDIX family)